MKRHRPRRGYTLFELVVVLALLLLLAAVVLPGIGVFEGDTRQRAGADAVRAELAQARARARDESKPYRVAISEDGRRLRREADGPDFGSAAGEPGSGSAACVDLEFERVTAEVQTLDGGAASGESGWITVATVLPDGSCREDGALVVFKDGNKTPLYVQVRGLTGSSRVVPNPNGTVK
ncbi:prepilin-type N-terminal cleavage/methylation domain-containing protein [Gemmata sp. JC673]|uniref:Prepilin-type N-terminal cleavage/methylation domain-containing protein n=1 Tax=Gemmata algarum TaxID=2975278 RepID=A0ABU5F5Y2_9BACT|nr:prepilin-type N-terminal cleavage/methylation domain-containing protein [Gemmata algarum]MDY3561673.1 prepilin-type N-terminal cleavage/methylation domain-containing protein [Gemmata algarum]